MKLLLSKIPLGVFTGFFIFTLFILTISLLTFFSRIITISENKLLITSKFTSFNNPTIVRADTNERSEPEILSKGIKPPVFASQAVLAEDVETGTILYQKNIHAKALPASTTKLMTALIGSSYFKNEDILTVPDTAIVGGSDMGLTPGEKLTYRSLLYGMMLNSGNDAAFTIASNYPGGVVTFVAAMNQKAKQLRLVNTHFDNPAGFDGVNHYSSASDLAKIAKEAIKNNQLALVVATKETLVGSIDSTKLHQLKNLNKLLLSEQDVFGIKTGFTEKAGENFIGLINRDGHKIITVVLNSADRFKETKTLADWVYDNYKWK